MMRRIIALLITLALGLLVTPLAPEAQLAGKVARIGWLASGFPPSEADRQRSPFFQGLRALGWVEGQNITIEPRYAEERSDRLPELAAELVQLNVHVIVVGDSAAIPAAKQATSTIPIVMTVSGDPVGHGYVASLARPGGNITGLSNLTPQLAGQRLEFLTEVVPELSRLAVLGPPGAPDWPELAAATQAVGVQLLALKVHRPEEFGGGIRSRREGACRGPHGVAVPSHQSLPAAPRRLGGTAPPASHVSLEGVRAGRRPHGLWAEYS
jgi:putative ABC transport system substrate-binding protein